MKGYAMLRIGEAGWIEKEDPKCGPMDAICRPIALAPCSSDIHTVYEGGVGERHNMMLGHEAVGEVIEVGSMVEDFKVGDQVIIPAITPRLVLGGRPGDLRHALRRSARWLEVFQHQRTASSPN